MKARIADLGGTALTGSPTDFGKFIADEIEKWAKVNQGRAYPAGVMADGHSFRYATLARPMSAMGH